MKKFIVCLLSISVFGCVLNGNVRSGEWKNIAYNGFAEKVNRIAGDGAVDCGFYDLTQKNKKLSKQVFDCINNAEEKGLAFKYGTKRIPIDSILYEVVIKDQKNVYWDIALDVALDQSDATHTIKKCNQIKFDYNSLSHTGNLCVDMSVQDWLADIE